MLEDTDSALMWRGSARQSNVSARPTRVLSKNKRSKSKCLPFMQSMTSELRPITACAKSLFMKGTEVRKTGSSIGFGRAARPRTTRALRDFVLFSGGGDRSDEHAKGHGVQAA